MGRTNRSAVRDSFTLIELLVVMAIIAVLAGLTIRVAGVIWQKMARNRALAEIQAMSTALESRKLDNGTYPPFTDITVATVTPSLYISAAACLLTNLNGGVNGASGAPSAPVYMSFTKKQIGVGADGRYYVQDPFGNPYGYCTAPSALMNPTFYDLWSTSGKTDGNATSTNLWKNNWSAQ